MSGLTIGFGSYRSSYKVLHHFFNSACLFETRNRSRRWRSPRWLRSSYLEVSSNRSTIFMLWFTVLTAWIVDGIVLLKQLICHSCPFILDIVVLRNEIAPKLPRFAVLIVSLINWIDLNRLFARLVKSDLLFLHIVEQIRAGQQFVTFSLRSSVLEEVPLSLDEAKWLLRYLWLLLHFFHFPIFFLFLQKLHFLFFLYGVQVQSCFHVGA